MSILLTGSKGFIGSGIHGPDGLDLKDGQDIRTYRRRQEYEVVIHTAALTSVVDSMSKMEEYFSTNVEGTLNMVMQHPEAHFIYLSTAGIYGEGTDHTVDSEAKPESIYARTKYLGEFVVRSLARSWTILRLTNVIGEGERGEPNVYQVFQKADVLPIYGDGLQTRDFIRVEEVRKVILKMMECREGGDFIHKGIFNIGSGIQKSVLEVAKEFDKPMTFLPARPGEIRNFGVKDAHNYSSFAQ